MATKDRNKLLMQKKLIRISRCFCIAKTICGFAAFVAALAMSQSAWAGDYWNGNGDGYWESNGGDANDNWDSGSDTGYFFTNGVYGTKTVKFNSSASFDTPVSIGGAENGTADDDPIVFLADADGYGFTTTADLKAGNSNIGHLWIKRGTFQCANLTAGNANNTGSLPLKIGGGDDKVAITATGNVDVNKGTMLITTNGTFCVGGLLRPGKVANLHGELMIDGGVVTNTGRYLSIADTANSTGTVTVKNGGKYCNINSDGEGIAVGQRGYGTLEILSGGEVNTTKRITLCTYNNTTAAVRIADGGLLVMPEIRGKDSLNGPASLTINGGTIRANGNNKTLIPKHNNLTVTVGASGGTIDNNGKNITINADLLGEGYMTLIGSGKTTIGGSQTGTGALNVNAGTVAVNGGVTVARPTTVANGATFTVNATSQATVNTLTLEAVSTLNIASYTGSAAALSVTTLTLPDSGTVALTLNGGAFPVGTYKILDKAGIAVADVEEKLVPSTGSEVGTFSVAGNTLVLTVGTPVHGRWRSAAGSGNFSDPGNWEDGQLPVAGDTLDFSGVTSSITINCGDMSETKFDAVTMGTGVITFTGSLTATSFSDTSKVAVGENSTVTLDGNLVFGGTTKQYIVYTVAAGGRFVVTGHIEASSDMTSGGELCPYKKAGAGAIQATGLLANEGTASDLWRFRLSSDSDGTANWIVGAEGLSGSKYFFAMDSLTRMAAIQPLDSDFIIATSIGVRAPLTLNTTGYDGNPHTITIGDGAGHGGIMRDRPVTIGGTGSVVANYDATALNTNHVNPFTVTNTATLALMPGSNLGTGLVTVNDGSTLQVAQSGTVTLGGGLTLKNGAVLGFNYTTRNAPVLDLTDKTVTFDEGATTNVVVKISADDGKRAKSGLNVLTAGGKLADATVSLAPGAPDWVLGVSVENGEIVIDVKPQGTVIRFR